VIDGEVVALDDAGRPSFNALQNGSAGVTIVYYFFDAMVLGARNVMGEDAGDAEGLAFAGDPA
jgi:ATP-dependent DNA ligase